VGKSRETNNTTDWRKREKRHRKEKKAKPGLGTTVQRVKVLEKGHRPLEAKDRNGQKTPILPRG